MNNDTPIDILQIKIENARDALPKETLTAIASVDWRAFILTMREKKGYSYEQLEDLELETELLLCGLLDPTDYPKEIQERLKIPKPQVDLLVQEMNEAVFKKIKDELIKNSEREKIFKKTTPAEQIMNYELGITNEKIKPIEQITKHETEEKKNTNILNKTEIETMPPEISAPVKTIPTEKITNYELGITNEKTKIVPTEINTKEEKKEPIKVESILSQKLSGPFQMKTTTTEYSLNNNQKESNKIAPTINSVSGKMRTSKIDPYRIDPNE